jgi:hypothetical protein
MISVLTTNVFPDRRGVDILIKCLGSQTMRDFEWVLVDGFYDENRSSVAAQCEAAGIGNVVHIPMCGGAHIPRNFHWELYNNALVIASNELFIRIGVFRWVAPNTLETAANLASHGAYLDLDQHHSEMNIVDYMSLSAGEINDREGMSPHEVERKEFMNCHAGMFSYVKERMVWTNGNNEAGELLVHHEDADLNSRWSTQRADVRVYRNCMMRIQHNKAFVEYIPRLHGNPRLPCMSERCIAASSRLYRIEEDFPPGAERFWHDDFEWCRCPDCGTISPINADRYIEHIRDWPIAPIGVDGRVGRDIRALRYDIEQLGSLQEKVELLERSHTDKRYIGG